MKALRQDSFDSIKALQFSQDHSAEASWFGSLEVSVWGGTNSLDLQAIDRADESYGLVICNHVLEHVESDRAALHEMFRILRTDGYVFLSFPDPLRRERTQDWGYPDAERHGHYRLYGRDVFAMLRSTLPNASFVTAVAVDPCTTTRELYFLICKRHETAVKLRRQLLEAGIEVTEDLI